VLPNVEYDPAEVYFAYYFTHDCYAGYDGTEASVPHLRTLTPAMLDFLDAHFPWLDGYMPTDEEIYKVWYLMPPWEDESVEVTYTAPCGWLGRCAGIDCTGDADHGCIDATHSCIIRGTENSDELPLPVKKDNVYDANT